MTLIVDERRIHHAILSFVCYICVLTFKFSCKIFTQITIKVVKIIVYFMISWIESRTKSYKSEIKEHLKKCSPKPSSKGSNTSNDGWPDDIWTSIESLKNIPVHLTIGFWWQKILLWLNDRIKRHTFILNQNNINLTEYFYYKSQSKTKSKNC